MKILPDVALTYDDVLLVPQNSDVDSRRTLSTKSWLTKKIALQSPIVSANMDVVTESEMAIAMAREGGIGIIHRFMTIAEQARQIERVKKAESFVVDHPITMTEQHTVGDVKRVVEETGTGGILIVDRDEKLIGIISTRDLLFENDHAKLVTEIMTRDVHSAAPGTSLKDAERLLHEYRVEKLPLVDERGKVAGLITLKDIMKITQYPKATKDAKGRLAVGAAVGVRDKEMRRVEAALQAGADCIVVDIAHGDSHMEIEMIEEHPQAFPRGADHRRECGDRRRDEAFDRGGRGRGEGRRGTRLHLCDSSGGGFGGAATHGDHRMCGRGASIRHPDHCRWRHPSSRRCGKGDCGGRAHGDDRLAACRHGRKPRVDHDAPRASLQGVARHGVADGEHRTQQTRRQRPDA